MPKVSVIVPVYNVEKYLVQCMESILSQTLDDIEILCIDDGSTDSSGMILDRYAEEDERVKVFHRSNAGYGAAMNVGLDAATGEYIGIVESDDCIQADMYSVLYNDAIREELDLIKSDAFYWIESVGYKKRIHYDWLDAWYNRVLEDEDRNLFFDFFMNIWTGIYTREYLVKNGIRFHESPGASYQDNGFWIQTLLYCHRAKWMNQAFYLYRQDNPGASVKSQSKTMVMTEEYRFLEKALVDRKDYHFLSYCYYYRLYRHRGTLIRIADEYKRNFCEQIRRDYKVYKGFIKGNTWLDNWFRRVLESPDVICSEMIRKRQEIASWLKDAKALIIYGTGKRGDVVFRTIYSEGYYSKLCCFAVSQNTSDELLAGRHILLIEKAHDLYPDALVILAVARESDAYRQMKKRLLELGIDNSMDGSDIEENLYMI